MNLDHFCTSWLEAWSGNQPEKLRQFYTENAFYRDPAKPNGLTGSEILPYFQKLLAKNPAWKWQALEIIPTQKGFCLKWKATIPVSNRVIEETGLDIVEIENNKIIRNEVYFDRAAFFQ